MPSVPGIPPPPKQTKPAQGFTDLFDPLEETPPPSNGETTATQPSAELFSDLPSSGGSNGNGPFDQQSFAPHAISSPFDESPTAMNNVANPFNQMFDTTTPSAGATTSAFGDSFDPLDHVSSTSSGSTSAFGDIFVDSGPKPTVNNEPAPSQPVQRPRPAPRTVGAVSLPPPPSKQSVKAAKLAAASGGTATPPVPVGGSNNVAPSQPSTGMYNRRHFEDRSRGSITSPSRSNMGPGAHFSKHPITYLTQ